MNIVHLYKVPQTFIFKFCFIMPPQYCADCGILDHQIQPKTHWKDL